MFIYLFYVALYSVIVVIGLKVIKNKPTVVNTPNSILLEGELYMLSSNGGYDEGGDIYKIKKRSKLSYNREDNKKFQCMVNINGDIYDLSSNLTNWNCSSGVDNPDAEEQWCQLRNGKNMLNLTYYTNQDNSYLLPTNFIHNNYWSC